MASKRIPQDVKAQVEEIVDRFNQKVIKDPNRFYVPRYRGVFVYLDRMDYGPPAQICRIKYTGDMNGWEFAIFKWSDERYDSDEWFFPGSQHVDGTVEGALQAGLKAYP